jgi:hypothetical protein
MTFYRHRVSGPGSAGDVWTTTMHSSGAANLATVHAAWGAVINTFWTGTYGAMLPNEVGANEIVTDQIDAVTGRNTAQARSAVAYLGTGAGATGSPRVCTVIGLKTALPTRSGRGRMFWPAPDSGHLTPTGLLVSADAGTIATAFGNALTTFKATSSPVIWHESTKSVDNITIVSVGIILGTQRRRTNKVQNAYSTKTI